MRVFWQVETDDEPIAWVAGDVTILQLPNYPGSANIPAGSYPSRLDYIGANFALKSEVVDPGAYEQRLDSLEQGAQEDSEARTLLANNVSALMENPGGFESVAYDDEGRVVLTSLTGETLSSGLPPETSTTPPSAVVVSETEPSGPYTLWYQTDSEGNLLGIYLPGEAS